MNLVYRKARSFVLLASGLSAIVFNNTIEGYSAMFGISLIVSALITLLFLFVYFDKPLNDKVLMEMMLDGFSGLVIFTYNLSDDSFFLTVFSFWIFINGLFYLSSGIIDKSNKKYLPLYTIVGIILLVFGFMPLHMNEESHGIIIYLIGFAIIVYSSSNLYLLFRKKSEIY